MHDDIDWGNASSDLGLVQLCREMDELAHPFKTIAAHARKIGRPGRTRVRPPRRQRFSPAA